MQKTRARIDHEDSVDEKNRLRKKGGDSQVDEIIGFELLRSRKQNQIPFAWVCSAIRQRTCENEIRIRLDSSTMFELGGPQVAGMQR